MDQNIQGTEPHPHTPAEELDETALDTVSGGMGGNVSGAPAHPVTLVAPPIPKPHG